MKDTKSLIFGEHKYIVRNIHVLSSTVTLWSTMLYLMFFSDSRHFPSWRWLMEKIITMSLKSSEKSTSRSEGGKACKEVTALMQQTPHHPCMPCIPVFAHGHLLTTTVCLFRTVFCFCICVIFFWSRITTEVKCSRFNRNHWVFIEEKKFKKGLFSPFYCLCQHFWPLLLPCISIAKVSCYSGYSLLISCIKYTHQSYRSVFRLQGNVLHQTQNFQWRQTGVSTQL